MLKVYRFNPIPGRKGGAGGILTSPCEFLSQHPNRNRFFSKLFDF